MGRGRFPGEFEQVVLLALAGVNRPASGRDVYERIVETVGREPSVAAIHITLGRMLEKGWVSRETSPPAPNVGGKPRHTYELSPEGAKVLSEQRRHLDRLWDSAARHRLIQEGES